MVAVIAVRVDRLFLPGNEIALPQPFKAVPGLAGSVPSIDGSSGPVALPSQRINVLVLGLDRRPSEGQEPTRSDSMFVLTLDPASKTGGVLSIPRDLWVELPDGRGGYFEDRINTAYRFGALNNYRGGPMQAARDAVEHTFPQIRIDYEVVIDFSSFIKIIDTLGGVDINVTEDFRYLEPVSVDDRNGVAPVFKRGMERMNGERALYYSRFRDGPDGDFGRIRRQQQVMMAVASKLASADALSRPLELWNRYKDAVETDIPPFRIPGLALLARQVGLDAVQMLSLGPVTRPFVTAGGADVLLADPADMAAIVNQLFYDGRLRREAATVEVQNSTTRAGLARATAGYLTQRGLQPTAVTVSAASPAPLAETIILNPRGKAYTAERLAEWLGIPASRIRTTTADARPAVDTATADITVILGRDAKLPDTPAPAGAARR